MNTKQAPFAAVIVAICCLFALGAGASNASAASQKGQQAPVENVEGTSSFHELIFEKYLTGVFMASGHTFVVTPATVVIDRYGAKTSLSSIRPGSIVRVRYRQENEKDPMTAVNVTVVQGPGE